MKMMLEKLLIFNSNYRECNEESDGRDEFDGIESTCIHEQKGMHTL